MPEQIIKISLTIASESESFRVLYVWKTEEALIVLSKLHRGSESFRLMATESKVEREFKFAVDRKLPVLHYAIGIGENYPKLWLGDYAPQFINRETDIPEAQRAECLYKDEYSDAQERIDTAFHNVMEYGRLLIRSWDDASFDNDRLFKLCNEPTIVARLLEQKTHNRDEQIVLACSYMRYRYLSYMGSKGKLTGIETDEVLNQLHSNKEQADSLKQFHDAYTPNLKRAVDEPSKEELAKRKKARSETATEQHSQATNSTSSNRVRFLKAPPKTVTPKPATADSEQSNTSIMM